MTTRAILALADGRVFDGVSIGAPRALCGEVVFNTSMTGYQEILTDPSYAKQFITFTYPHIGNVGVNGDDCEAAKIWASGLICRDVPVVYSSWRALRGLREFLQYHEMVGIAGIDTRELTHYICEHGAQQGCLMAGDVDVDRALALARASHSLEGMDLAQEVSAHETYTWNTPSLKLNQDFTVPETHCKVVVYDYGVKSQILRLLVDRGCEVVVVPARTPVEDVLKLKPEGVLLSNGPGDPAPCDYAISAIQTLLAKRIPIFGICLGFQLLALATGAKTLKMKFGHHGANHPVQDCETKKVMITSQNHGFAVDEASLPSDLTITHRSLFDNTLQGFHCKNTPAFGFQGHPEASPGPNDIELLFDHFIELIQHAKT